MSVDRNQGRVIFFAIIGLTAPLLAYQANWQQLHQEVLRLNTQQRFKEALPLALEELRLAEATFGVAHQATAVSTYEVANIYDVLARVTEAETFYRRALALEEKAFGYDHPETLKCMNNLASLYTRLHRDTDAIPMLESVIRITERGATATSRGYGAPAMVNLAEIYSAQGKLAEAEDLYRKAVVTREQDPSTEMVPLDYILHRFGVLYNKMRKHSEAEQVLRRALPLRERLYGADQPQTAEILHALGATQANLQHYEQGEELLRRALRIRERSLGLDSPDVADTLDLLGKTYWFRDRPSEAEPFFRRSLAIREKALGPRHELTLGSLAQLAKLYFDLGQYTDAEPLYRRALNVREATPNENPAGLASALSALGTVYASLKRPSEAATLCKRAVDLVEKTLGNTHPDLSHPLLCLSSVYQQMERIDDAESLLKRCIRILQAPDADNLGALEAAFNNLGELYRQSGRLGEVEPLLRQSLELARRLYTERSTHYATPLNNLGLYYADQGRYAEAEPLHRQALAIVEADLGPDNLQITYPLNGLASLYMAQGRYGEAEPLLRRALRIRERIHGLDSSPVGTIINNLATIYTKQGRNEDAEPLHRRALAIDEKTLGPEHPIVAIDLGNLALNWQWMGKTTDVEALFLRALRIVEKMPGRDRPQMITPLKNLASFYFSRGDFETAGPLFERALDELERQFLYHFSYMNEKTRLAFLATASDLFSQYFSYCLLFHKRQPSVAGKMYDVVLWRKGMIARSIASLRSQIGASGDTQAVALLEQLTQKKSRLAALEVEQQPAAQSREAARQLEREIDELETALVRRSATFSQNRRLSGVKWRDIAGSLGSSDAAVEFVRFDVHDGNKWTGDHHYAALILTAGASAPELVSLGEAGVLEAVPFRDYRDLVTEGPRDKDSGKAFYSAVWRPIELALGQAQRIYLSPDGVFNQVSWAVIPSSDGRLLLERYEIETLLSTRDLLRTSTPSRSRTAILFGAPDFNAAGRGVPAAGGAQTGVLGAPRSLPDLKGTRREIQSVKQLLEQNGWTVAAHTGTDALEDRVKAVRSPRLLHFATHGFFLPDKGPSRQPGDAYETTIPDEPMLRSGLYLAGANRVLNGGAARPDVDDGVLTAFEASSLNLQGTELVIMSACETGAGNVQNGEGVFGLPRAMQEAGAEAILMSLWNVPDIQTTELMELFYKKWLAGASKQKALREAQLEMRARIMSRFDGQDNPSKWGAFVMLGR